MPISRKPEEAEKVLAAAGLMRDSLDGAGVRVSWGWSAQGEAEEVGGVVIADVFDHGAEEIFTVR